MVYGTPLTDLLRHLAVGIPVFLPLLDLVGVLLKLERH
jgi:hypothetical protein